MDCGYSTWSGATLYYREFPVQLDVRNHARSRYHNLVRRMFSPVKTSSRQRPNVLVGSFIGDRVDYWISADNGTHWEEVESESTIHFDHPGKELVWKAQLIGSTAVSWWVDIEYATDYEVSGGLDITLTSPPVPKSAVRPSWTADVPAGTTLDVVVSNDNGSTWLDASNNQETSFSTEAAGNTLRYAIFFSAANSDVSPSIDEFVLEYEEGYPDRPMLDVGGDGTYDWESDIFLNESSVVASDDSLIGEIVKKAPTLVDAFNDHIPENGDGTVNIPIAVKAASSGRRQDLEH